MVVHHVLSTHLKHIIMDKSFSIFSGFKSEEPKFPEMQPVTDHPFILIGWGYGDSFTHPSGAPKTNLPPWEDATPEVWTLWKSNSGAGSIFYHIHGAGYRAGESLTKEEIESGEYEVACAYKDKKGNPIGATYAIQTNDKGQKVRKVDAAKTEQCRNIFNQILAALGFKPGATVEDLNVAMEEKRVVIANVVQSEFDGNSQVRIGSWRNPAKVKTVAGEEGWDGAE